MLATAQNIWDRIKPQSEFDPELHGNENSDSQTYQSARFLSGMMGILTILGIMVTVSWTYLTFSSNSSWVLKISSMGTLANAFFYFISYLYARKGDVNRSVYFFIAGVLAAYVDTILLRDINISVAITLFFMSISATTLFLPKEKLVGPIVVLVVSWILNFTFIFVFSDYSQEFAIGQNILNIGILMAVASFSIPIFYQFRIISVLSKLMGTLSLLALSIFVIVTNYSKNYSVLSSRQDAAETLGTLTESQASLISNKLERQIKLLNAIPNDRSLAGIFEGKNINSSILKKSLNDLKSMYGAGAEVILLDNYFRELGYSGDLFQEITIVQPALREAKESIGVIQAQNLIYISLPLDSGTVAVIYPAKVLSSLLTSAALGETGEADIFVPSQNALITPNGIILVSSQQAEELHKLSVSNGGELTYQGEPVLGRGNAVAGTDWIVVAHQHVSEIDVPALRQADRIQFLLAISAGLIWLALIWFSQIITRPINNLKDIAQRVREGDYQAVATVEGTDEIGLMTGAFNRMTRTLRETLEGLEDRVNERTRDLEVATQVSKQITQVLRLEELLPKLVENTKDGFGLYFCSVYLYDEKSRQLVLSAGTGEAGAQMKAEGKVYDIEARPSIVAEAGREKKAVVIGDVTQSNIYNPNPFLPDTRSEAAIPMVAQGELVGVLGIQSVELNDFSDEDLRILTSLAEQIGVAVRNAVLYEEQLHVADELKKVDEMKSQFLSSMSHELRTPLNAIINFVEMVATGLIGPVSDEQAGLLNQSLNSSKHLLHLINDVLDISKIQAGKLSLFVEENVDLQEEIRAVTTMVGGMVNEKPDLQFIQDIDPNLPPIAADKRRVRQVLLNLLTNAIKFTEKGRVTLSVKKTGDSIHFAVIDTGVGIEETAQSVIFEPFVQTADGVKQVQGTGLGLPISRSLIEAHGGKLRLESIPGRGSTFTFTLPVKFTEPYYENVPTSSTVHSEHQVPQELENLQSTNTLATSQSIEFTNSVSNTATAESGLNINDLVGPSSSPIVHLKQATDSFLPITSPAMHPSTSQPGENNIKLLLPGLIVPSIAAIITAIYFYSLFKQTGDWHYKAVLYLFAVIMVIVLGVALSISTGKRKITLFLYYLSGFFTMVAFGGPFVSGVSIPFCLFFGAVSYIQLYPLAESENERRAVYAGIISILIMGPVFEFVPFIPDRPELSIIFQYVICGLCSIVIMAASGFIIPQMKFKSVALLLTQSSIGLLLVPLWGLYPLLRNQGSPAIAAFVILVIIGSIFASIRATNSIARPLRILTEAAQRIGINELSTRVSMDREDELGILAETLNKTTENLERTVSELEHRVNERTRDLEVATQVSKQITQVLRLEELLPNLVENTKEGFGLYFCSVYLYDEKNSQLVLSAGTGEAGVQMKAEGKVYDLEARPSIVAEAGREKKAVVIGDVTQSNIYNPNPFLPDTRSEAAIPMIAQGELVGVLGVQSVEVNHFRKEDLRILTSLAEQIGVAVRNAVLYEEQLHVADELKKVDEMKSQFLSSMSHELRTPLNAIINFVEMVATGLIGPVSEEQADLLNQSLNSSKHLLYLINDVLDISKIQAGKLALFVEEDVNLKEEVDLVMNMIGGMLKEKPQLQFVHDIDPHLPRIAADKRRIRQVLLNLLTNAIKFTEKGTITLSVKENGNSINFAVMDTGVGIEDAAQGVIFEPFIQTADGLQHIQGTGLGLPISRSLVEAHGGKLWLESTPGEGSVFFFTLPNKRNGATV